MKKLYILIRKDLSASQQAVQGGHALAEFLLEHPTQGKEWGNHTLIYLGIDSEKELLDWAEVLGWKEMPYSIFREPDIGNQATALACYGDSKLFTKLKLL